MVVTNKARGGSKKLPQEIDLDGIQLKIVITMLQEFHPKVLRTSLSNDQEAKLKEAFGGVQLRPDERTGDHFLIRLETRSSS